MLKILAAHALPVGADTTSSGCTGNRTLYEENSPSFGEQILASNVESNADGRNKELGKLYVFVCRFAILSRVANYFSSFDSHYQVHQLMYLHLHRSATTIIEV